MRAHRLSAFALAVTVAFAAGCASSGKPPEVAQSGTQAVFAIEYGENVTTLLTQYNQHRDEARSALGQLSAKAGEVKGVKGGLALQVVDAADSSGKSEAYVEERRKLAHARAFFAEGKTDIGNRVAGAAQQATKGCADVSGAVAGSLKDAVEKSAEKQLRQSSEAFMIIERQRPSLGAQAAPLEKLADDVSNASYVAHVELPSHRERLKQLVAEADQVKKTADEFLQTEGRFQAEAGRTEPEKKSSRDRVDAMNKGKAEIDPAVTQAKSAIAKMDDEITTLQREYADAIAKLRRELPSK